MEAANWIPDVNRWQLPTPPAWFLTRLWDFDHMLVLVPSRVAVKDCPPRYLLCRRREHSAGLGDVALLDNKHPDTNMCYAHGIVPVAPLSFNNGASTFTEAGCTSLLAELAARDMWAVSGGAGGDGDAVVDALEAGERAVAVRERATLRDTFHHMGRDAWRSLTARTGSRNKTPFDGNRFAQVGGARQGQRKIIVS